MKGEPSISPVYRLGGDSGTPDPERVFAKCWSWMRRLWVEHGVISLYPRELPEPLRTQIEQWANDTYGRRKK